MSTNARTQIACLFAAVFCAFITVGTSVAPAIPAAAAYLA